MHTIYGIRRPDGTELWGLDMIEAQFIVKSIYGYSILAREQTSSRVVSVR